MHMSRKFFCLPGNWIYLVQNYFSSYVSLKDIYKTLKGNGKIHFFFRVNNFVQFAKVLNFMGVLTKIIEIIKA